MLLINIKIPVMSRAFFMATMYPTASDIIKTLTYPIDNIRKYTERVRLNVTLLVLPWVICYLN